MSPAWSPRRPLGYPKRFRVRTAADHQAMRRARRMQDPLATVLVRPNGRGHPRFGFAVSRKVGNAVCRNRIKRRLREVFRHVRADAPAVDLVVIARPPMAGVTHDTLRDLVDRGLALAVDRRQSRAPRPRSSGDSTP